jgi:hypothetical protein
LEHFLEAAHRPCICESQWARYASASLLVNSIDVDSLCSAVLVSLRFGRDETVPAVTLVGRRGGEGKSFFFAPMRELFGLDYVQPVPQKGTFPLLNLEKKKIALLEEWGWNDNVIPVNTMLQWLKGKAVSITRPQNFSQAT